MPTAHWVVTLVHDLEATRSTPRVISTSTQTLSPQSQLRTPASQGQTALEQPDLHAILALGGLHDALQMRCSITDECQTSYHASDARIVY